MGKRGGRNFRGRGRGRGGGGGRGGQRGGWGGGRDTRQNYNEVPKTNAKFEEYYNSLDIVDEDEREKFWEALRRELPNSFRFAGSKGHALTVQQRLINHYIPEIKKVRFDGNYVDPPTPIEWYPDTLAWQMTTPKNIVRKFAPFASFQKFLVSETSVGNISRQEIVSMIPPLVMDIKPGMTVLDMCAAPGSKSAQLIELVHGGEEARVRKILREMAAKEGREMSPDGFEVEIEKSQAETEGDWSDYGRATGLLVANDANYQRAQMLVHQVKRLNSPNMLVTNHDATMFPSIQIPSDGKTPKYLKFDRILADVPCSGDGTARKNPNVWKDWIPGNALGLYIVQVRILVRSLQMLKVGGRVVYSTCSMNPVENEAIVCSAVERCGGPSKVKLLNTSKALPGLVRKPGLKKWKVMDKAKRIWSSWNDVKTAQGEGENDGMERLVEGMFPPEAGSEEAELPLEHCMRIYPHLQDTGGFFVAVLEKQSEIRAKPEGEAKKTAPKPKVTALVDQIEANTANGTDAPLTALDDFPHTEVDPDNMLSDGNAPAAARQNQPNRHLPDGFSSEILSSKRSSDEVDAVDDNELPFAKKARVGAEERHEDTATVPPSERALNGQSDDAEPNKDEQVAAAQRAPVASTEMQPAERVANSTDMPAFRSLDSAKRKNNQPHEEPFIFLSPDHSELDRIRKFYEISDKFPTDRFMVRNATGEPVKAIYYTSELAKGILQKNAGSGMKFVHCGVKMFMKQDAQGQDICRWRIQSEGIPIIESWVGSDRIVRLYKRETLRKLLIEMFPKVAGDGYKDLAEIGERVKDISGGCCVLRVETSDDPDGFKERLVLPLWRSISSLNLMLPKEERKAMLLRLFNDDSPLIDHSKERFNKDRENGEAVKKENDAENEMDIDGSQSPEMPPISRGGGGAPVTDALLTALGEPETELDKFAPEEKGEDEDEGGVPLPPDGPPEVDEQPKGLGPTGLGEESTEREEVARAKQQAEIDDRKEREPGIPMDEDDTFNKTV